MKAWFLLGPRELVARQIPDPVPSAEQAVVRVRAVGVCGSDTEAFTGRHPLPNYPRLPGHEFAGEVAAVAPGWTGPPVGTRVAVDPALSCGECYACKQGRHNCCSSVSIAGVHRPGAMAEYALCRASQLHPIPDSMTFATAATVETLSIGWQAVTRAQVKADDRVVVLGAGPIGLCCMMMARLKGAQVLVSEPLGWRRALAGELRADVCVDPNAQAVSESVQAFTSGYGAHVVMDATGEVEGAELAFRLVGSAGRVVILTLLDEPVRVKPWQLVRQELTVVGSRLSLASFGELVGIAASRKAPIERLVSHRYAFEQAPKAFADSHERPQGFVKAIVEVEAG